MGNSVTNWSYCTHAGSNLSRHNTNDIFHVEYAMLGIPPLLGVLPPLRGLQNYPGFQLVCHLKFRHFGMSKITPNTSD